MKKAKSISEVITGVNEYDKLLAASEKARKRRKREILAPPIGHYLALILFSGSIPLDTLFVNGIDICNSYTTVHIDDRTSEVYPVSIESVDFDHARARIYYKNDTSIEIIRIS